MSWYRDYLEQAAANVAAGVTGPQRQAAFRLGADAIDLAVRLVDADRDRSPEAGYLAAVLFDEAGRIAKRAQE